MILAIGCRDIVKPDSISALHATSKRPPESRLVRWSTPACERQVVFAEPIGLPVRTSF
jgi:hypothetical protein